MGRKTDAKAEKIEQKYVDKRQVHYDAIAKLDAQEAEEISRLFTDKLVGHYPAKKKGLPKLTTGGSRIKLKTKKGW